jgi:NAD dependent epimerase/dehydratase family enzyme
VGDEAILLVIMMMCCARWIRPCSHNRMLITVGVGCSEEISGPVNVCAPNPVTNDDFIKAFAHHLHRPALCPMPEAVVKLVFGEMGEQTLLVSQRTSPDKLLSTNFRFLHRTIEDGIRASFDPTYY